MKISRSARFLDDSPPTDPHPHPPPSSPPSPSPSFVDLPSSSDTTSLKSFRLLTAVHLGTHSVTDPASVPQPVLTPLISDAMVDALQCLHMQHLGKGCTQCLKAALDGPEKEKWIMAIEKELSIGNKIVLRRKRGPTGLIEHYKARVSSLPFLPNSVSRYAT